MPTGNLKAFISYSHRNRRLARQVRDCLVAYGLDVFLAHDDIEPSAEWARVIQAELRDCGVFLPVLTHEFPDSKWTDQETGMAVVTGKLIIPLRVDIDPYGFIGSIQGLRLDPDSLAAACSNIARTIGRKPEYRERFLDGLIRMFSESGSFEEAGRYADRLLQFEGYSPQQVRRVLLATIENGQIHQSFMARRRLKEFIQEYGRDADAALVRRARAAMHP